MRTFASIAAAVAVAMISPAVLAQSTALPHVINSPDDLSIPGGTIPKACIYTIGFAEDNKPVGQADCDNQAAFDAIFKVGDKMTVSWEDQKNGRRVFYIRKR